MDGGLQQQLPILPGGIRSAEKPTRPLLLRFFKITVTEKRKNRNLLENAFFYFYEIVGMFVRSFCLKEEEHEISGKTVVFLLPKTDFPETRCHRFMVKAISPSCFAPLATQAPSWSWC